MPGVNCEACHGPGAKHVSLMDEEETEQGRQAMANPIPIDPHVCGLPAASHSVPDAVEWRSNEASIYGDDPPWLPGAGVRIRGQLPQAELDGYGQVHGH